MEHKIFQDNKYYFDSDTGYWISTKTPHKRLHVAVWESINGKVPKGFHIHHFDHDKSNNDISNLMLVSSAIHSKLHWDEEKREQARKHAALIRPLTKKWHGSEEGLKWHSEHGKETWKSKEYIREFCVNCGKAFDTQTYHQLFCSNKCKSAWRRYKGKDKIEVTCEFCKKTFSKNKYSKSTCCSKKCGCKLSWSKGERNKATRVS